MFSNKSDKKFCPLLRKPCMGIQCAWYIHIRGQDPQTGEAIDQYDCTAVMQPLLMIENSQQQRQTAAAVESFRNEMVKANEQSRLVWASAALGNNLLGDSK